MMDPSPSISQKQHPLPFPGSVPSSPPHHYHNDTADLLLLPHVPGSKLRLMCSYGGHIMPRDNSLYYIGGDTRIVAVDRHSSLSHLFSHLSRTLLHGRRPFTLKYHLPNEDLDNLITVSTDEDLQNMIDEYDRLSSNPSPSRSRLRLFLFFSKPDTAVSMGNDRFDNHAWFVEALNNSGILSRVVSDSAAVVDNCLLNLDDYDVSASSNDENTNNNVIKEHLIDVDYSVTVEEEEEEEEENMFNYLIANLSEIRVCVDHDDDGSGVKQEQRLRMEQQQDNNFDDVKAVDVKQNDPFLESSYCHDASAGYDFNRVVSDDRKPPLPSLIVQPRTTGAGLGLPSPDSLASDTSIASACVDNKDTTLPNNIKSEVFDQNQQGEQAKDPDYTPPQQQLNQNQQPQTYQQNQFVYIHRPIGTGQVPMSSYYPVYASPTPSQSHQQLHQYPVYVMPIGHGSTQPYNIALQSNLSDTNVVASTRPLIPQSVVPEVNSSVYKTPMASNPSFIQVPFNQYQQQYVNLPQNIHHPPRTIYGNEYGGAMQEQLYYTQQQPANANAPPQYQSMIPAPAAAALLDVSKQFPIDNNIQQQNKTSQQV